MLKMTEVSRKFLAISDDTEECLSAMTFAAMRARAVGAGLVFLRCARMPGPIGWIGLDRAMSEEAVDAARIKLNMHAELVAGKTGLLAELKVSDEEPLDAIRNLVEADPAIKVLVLAAGSSRWGPGPLVSRISKGRALADRPIAVTVIPGNLSDAQLREMGGQAG
jgi:nucleotide-binding universal stress UspA family protein